MEWKLRLPAFLVLALILIINPATLVLFSPDHGLSPHTVSLIWALDVALLAISVALFFGFPKIYAQWSGGNPATQAWILGGSGAAVWAFLIMLHFWSYGTPVRRLFHTGIEGTVPSLYSAFLYVPAAYFAFQLAQKDRAWYAVSAVILYLGLDEGAAIHEHLEVPLVVAIYGVAAFILLAIMWPRLRTHWPFLLAGALFATSLWLDNWGETLLELHHNFALQRGWRVVEDTAEVFGTSTLLGLLWFEFRRSALAIKEKLAPGKNSV
ncbi:MAG: hypothetical protein V1784_04705 [bacterium]